MHDGPDGVEILAAVEIDGSENGFDRRRHCGRRDADLGRVIVHERVKASKPANSGEVGVAADSSDGIVNRA